jgi:hypothetical protein
MAGPLRMRGALTNLIKRGPEDSFGIWGRLGRPGALFVNYITGRENNHGPINLNHLNIFKYAV